MPLEEDDIQPCSSNSSELLRTACKEYGGLYRFITTVTEPIKSQLNKFLYPLYVYTCLALFKENVKDAKQFVSHYAKPFLKAQGYEDAIRSLERFQTFQDVKNHSYFSKFCKSKSKIRVSEDSLKCLTSYLKDTNSEILQSIVLSKIDTVLALEEKEGSSATKDNKLHSIYCIPRGNSNVCSAFIGRKTNVTACGFEDSSIHIWNRILDFKSSKEADDPSIIRFNLNEAHRLSSDCESNKESKPRSENSHRILNGHKGPVYGLSFAHAHNFLLSCSKDATIRAWNMETYESASVYSVGKYPIWDVSVSRNRDYFATASMDSTARLWTFEHQFPLRIFVDPIANVDRVRFHPNGNYIATASSDRRLHIWEVESGRSVRTFSDHSAYITCIVFSPDGKCLASSDADGGIKIWDLASGKTLHEINAHTKGILSIAYSESGSLLASGGYNGFLKIWDTQDGHETASSAEKDETPKRALGMYGTSSVLHYIDFEKRDQFMAVGTPM